MSYTTTGQAAAWVANAAAKNLSQQREEVIDLLNRVRRLIYNAYQEIPLQIDVEEAFTVQQMTTAAETFRGVTLPAYMQTVEAAWKCGSPVRLYSKWREYHTGLAAQRASTLSSYDVPGGVPTELPMMGAEDTVGVIAKCAADCGKVVSVRGTTPEGTQLFSLPLSTKAWTTIPRSISQILPGGVILPTDLRGGVLIRQTRGERILSEYVPGEHVPDYGRIKIPGAACGDVVLIRASRRFLPVWFDTDIVETDNQLAWEEGARYFRYSDSGTDASLAVKADRHLASFGRQLLGEHSRELGKAKADPLNFARKPVRSRLGGNSR